MSSPETVKPAPVVFEGVCPILRVKKLSDSVEYYCKRLGFKLDWGSPDDEASIFASVSRGSCHIFLSEGDQGNPGAWVWIGVEDAAALFQEYRASGARIRHPPTNYPWACEMQVEDLDSNILRMGSDNKKSEPVGEWLDMNGVRWLPQPDGGWKRAE